MYIYIFMCIIIHTFEYICGWHMDDIWMVYGRYMDGIWQVNTCHRQDRPSRPDADARIRNQLLT